MSAFAAIKWARSAPVVRRGNGKPDATAHHVLLVLATYADKDGRARPSVATLAEDSVLAVDTVDAALCRLVSAGLIEAEESYGGSGCVVWRLRMDLSRDGSRADVLTERQERARRATADRVARFRERRNGIRGRYATLSGTVTDDVVTPSDTVTDEVVTVSETVCNGVGDRDVTVSDPESNASDTVTSAGQGSRTAIELPVRTANELPAREARGTKTNRRGTRIPEDFEATTEMINWARENTPLVGKIETEKFRDYWRGVAGQRGVKLDWVATWRNWMRKAQSDAEQCQPRRPIGAPTTGSRRMDKAFSALAPNDPLRVQLGLGAPALLVIEGGQTA
jgi:hypothetical protein